MAPHGKGNVSHPLPGSLPLLRCCRNPTIRLMEKSQLRRGWRCRIHSPQTLCFPFPFLNLPFPSCSRFFEHGLMCRLDLLFCRSCSLLVVTSSSTRQVCLIRDSIFLPVHASLVLSARQLFSLNGYMYFYSLLIPSQLVLFTCVWTN